MQTHPIITHYVMGTSRNFLMGGSLCFAIQSEKYWEIPILFVFPSIYSGFYAFKNKDHIINDLKKSFKSVKTFF